jgi:hypothetical protein
LSDPPWIGKAQDHLLSHLQIFGQSFTTHSDIRIRKEIVNICSGLVKFCSKTALSNLHLLLFEIISTLSVDEDLEIRREGRKCVRKLLQIFTQNQKVRLSEKDCFDGGIILRPLVEQLQLKIFGLSEKFSIRTKIFDEFELTRDLANFSGSLYLLKEVEDSSGFFYSETYVGKLAEAILNLVPTLQNFCLHQIL